MMFPPHNLQRYNEAGKILNKNRFVYALKVYALNHYAFY